MLFIVPPDRKEMIADGDIWVMTRNTNNVQLTTTQTFKLGNQVELEAVGMYNSALNLGIVRVDARAGLDLGIQKKFDSGATLAFNATDVFNSVSQWRLVGDARATGVYYDWLWNSEGPVFRLNFSMPIGNQNIREKNRRNSGSVEEQERLN